MTGTLNPSDLGFPDTVRTNPIKVLIPVEQKEAEVADAVEVKKKTSTRQWLERVGIVVLVGWLILGLLFNYGKLLNPPPLWPFAKGGHFLLFDGWNGQAYGGQFWEHHNDGGTNFGSARHIVRAHKTCRPGLRLHSDGWCYAPYVRTPNGDPRYDVSHAGCMPGTTRSFSVALPDGGQRRVDQTCE